MVATHESKVETAQQRIVREIRNGDSVPLNLAARLMADAGRPNGPHMHTLVRWAQLGWPDGSGNLVRLEAVKIGHRWVTSKAAVSRFLSAMYNTAAISENRQEMTAAS